MSWDDTNYRSGDADASDADGGDWDDTDYRSGDADASDPDNSDWVDTDDDRGQDDTDDSPSSDTDDDGGNAYVANDSADVTVLVSIEAPDVDERLASVRSRYGSDAAVAMAVIRELLRHHSSAISHTAYIELLVALTNEDEG
jgi:hypothetical protein